jgi:hypothetical protein
LFHPAAPDRVRPDDPATPPPAVSPSLRRRATMATMNGAGSRLSVGSPQPRLGSFPRPPHTWKDMKSQGAKNAPVLLEIPKTEDAFEKGPLRCHFTQSPCTKRLQSMTSSEGTGKHQVVQK